MSAGPRCFLIVGEDFFNLVNNLRFDVYLI